MADDKTETGRKLEVIGYTVCLDTERVGIAEKNFLKALLRRRMSQRGWISSKRRDLRRGGPVTERFAGS